MVYDHLSAYRELSNKTRDDYWGGSSNPVNYELVEMADDFLRDCYTHSLDYVSNNRSRLCRIWPMIEEFLWLADAMTIPPDP